MFWCWWRGWRGWPLEPYPAGKLELGLGWWLWEVCHLCSFGGRLFFGALSVPRHCALGVDWLIGRTNQIICIRTLEIFIHSFTPFSMTTDLLMPHAIQTLMEDLEPEDGEMCFICGGHHGLVAQMATCTHTYHPECVRSYLLGRPGWPRRCPACIRQATIKFVQEACPPIDPVGVWLFPWALFSQAYGRPY